MIHRKDQFTLDARENFVNFGHKLVSSILRCIYLKDMNKFLAQNISGRRKCIFLAERRPAAVHSSFGDGLPSTKLHKIIRKI